MVTERKRARVMKRGERESERISYIKKRENETVFLYR